MVRPRTLASRLMATVALVGFLFSALAESATGMLADGAVHHETSGVAAAHGTLTPAAEHGHEDGSGATPEHDHDPGHDHGTTRDHCTHAHGLFLTGTLSWECPLLASSEHPTIGRRSTSAPTEIHAPPPRA